MVLWGRLLMTVAISIYAFIPPVVDLVTDTHVFHQGWMPHARMHTVWLLGATSGVGLLALYLLWAGSWGARSGINLAALLSGIIYGAFFLSAATTGLYGGALSDASGGVGPGPLGIDANVFTFALASALLVAGWLLARKSAG